MKFLKTLFGGGPEKDEEKGDELRLDLEYREAAHFYRQALGKIDPSQADDLERLQGKLRDVRRSAFQQMLESSEELMASGDLDLAREQLEMAKSFAEGEQAERAVDAAFAKIEEQVPEEIHPTDPKDVSGTEGDLFELALSGFDPEDRERATVLGHPFRQGYEAFQEERWDESVERFETVLKAHPEEALVLEMIGLVKERKGDLEGALEAYRSAAARSPGRPVTVQGMAASYRKLGRSGEALNVLAEGVSSHPIRPNLPEAWIDVHVEHALALSEGGHHDDAISTIVSLLDARSTDRGNLYYNLGGILERAGKIEECRAALARAIQASPRNPVYRERLADVLVRLGTRLDEALRLLIEANEVETTAGGSMFGGGGGKVAISPNRARYLYKIARVYFLKGEDLEAERTVTTALAVSRDPEVTGALDELRKEIKQGA